MTVRSNGAAARALALGLAAGALCACASMPAPIVAGSQRPTPSDGLRPERMPFDRGAPPRVADATAGLQCVPFARRESGIQIYGDANTWWDRAAGRYPRSSRPSAGSVVVIEGYYGPGRGHVAVVRDVVSERVIRVDHANWLNHGEISVGVPVLDVSPNNDWSQIRVWHIPGSHWGGRIYAVEGFIHPFALPALS